ncbi:energy transducer TonB [Halotia branconii]|uniref:TonB family protein n=1 Tax=Halotia branconii CENA392 TaxID=1539056 RepID=A0AAJ6NRM9_9CYAN|nr:TonB family protein [Halotia branconii]WGV25337.1 TonB family protein [Halotia branconii CENA392]
MLLASGIGRYLFNNRSEVEDELVEITLLDTPPDEIAATEEVKPKPEPLPEKKFPVIDTSKPQRNLDTTANQSRVSAGSSAISKLKPIPTQGKVAVQTPPVVEQPIPKPDIKPFKQFKQVEPLSPAPASAVREKPIIPESKPEKPEPVAQNNNQPPIPQPKPETRTPRKFLTPVTPLVQPSQPTPQDSEDLKDLLAQSRDFKSTPREFSTPVTPAIESPASKLDANLKRSLTQERSSRRTARDFSNPVAPSSQSSAPTQQDSTELNNTLSGIRESRDNSKLSSNNTALSSPDTSNIGESSDNAPRRRRRSFAGNIATAPNTVDTGTSGGLGNDTGDLVGDGDGRAACRKCDKVYPDWAKRQGIEGKITVAVDTDAQGNVINVRLLSSSGNSRLDKEHLELARNWKLKPSSNGRQSVRIVTKYEIH